MSKRSKVTFYLDDSGTRQPDRNPGRRPAHECDYFAIGGVLVGGEEENVARDLHAQFCERWEIDYPLHSVEIRGKTKNFAWLGELDDVEQPRFYGELAQMLVDAPVLGLACVVDRPGYNDRYLEKFGEDRWLLCKTAFCIAVERASKFAARSDSKLVISPERCNKVDDGLLTEYYRQLKNDGHPFGGDDSEKYVPLDQDSFNATLHDIRFKAKSSPMAQFADLYLWPMAMGGYHASNRTYRLFVENNKLIDQVIDPGDVAAEGIKYSCFDSVVRKP